MYHVIIIQNHYNPHDFEAYGWEGDIAELPEKVEDAKYAEGGIMAPEWKHIETHSYPNEVNARRKWKYIHPI
jgi:hypothetical protein